MSEKTETAPDDFTTFYAGGGGLVALIAGGFVIANYGWLVFAQVFGAALALGWMAAVVWLLWSINARLKKRD